MSSSILRVNFISPQKKKQVQWTINTHDDLYQLIKGLEIKDHGTAHFLDLMEPKCLIQQYIIAPKLLE